jgi:hypothetical protein
MNTFVYVNGRPDHQKGHHDDLIMSISIALYVGESSFSSLERVTEQTKAMLDSWTVNNNESVKDIINFNPQLPHFGFDNRNNNMGATKKDYENYGWLFGGR